MAGEFQVEPVAEHEYVVRAEVGLEIVESRFRVDPAVLQQLGVGEADEQRVVEQSAIYLARQQPVADFPGMVDVEDLVVRYDDYPEQLRRMLSS
ncbi:MAG TPA: hypothetical protein VIL00_03495 [Pseudonocardiaceae bacterium]